LGAVVGRTEQGKTGLHPSVRQASMGHSSACRLNQKERKIFTWLKEHREEKMRILQAIFK